MTLAWETGCGFTAKVEMKKVPLIGAISIITGAFFMDRVGTSEEREKLVSLNYCNGGGIGD